MVSEEKLFNNIMILYMYAAHGLWKRTLAEYKILIVTKSFCYFNCNTSAIFVFVCVFIALKGHSFYNLIYLCQNAGTCQALIFIE